jgi:hypothetical protein
MKAAQPQQVTEVDQQWPGWHVWLTRERRSIVATRTNRQQPVDDGVWARTLIVDDWDQLERELAVQAECDAARS